MIGRLRDRLRALLRRDAVLGEIDEEMRAHLELAAEAHRRRGLPPDEARRAAEREFGNLGAMRDVAYDVKGGGMLEALGQDLRFGTRVLRKAPATTLAALLTWALGIGATVAVFSVVKPLLLDPLPFREPARLLFIGESLPPKLPKFSVASGNFAAWRDAGGPFDQLVAFRNADMVLVGGGDPLRVNVRRVTDGYFALFGVPPLLGRAFVAEEDVPDHELVAVLAHGFWQRRFGGDPAILGRTLALDGRSYTVVGVMPPNLHPAVGQVDLWVPAALTAKDRENHGGHSYHALARLAPGATIEQARAHLGAVEAHLAEQFSTVQGWSPLVSKLSDELLGGVRPSLVVLAVAVAFVLLIACANVASLLLGRAAAREREIAIRAALGAGRGRIVRQLATESLLLAIAGGALGLALAVWGVDLLLVLGPRGLPGLEHVTVDLPLLGFTVGASLVAGLVVGLAPALQAARGDLGTPLKEGGRTGTAGAGHARVRRTLVAVEVAACVLLLVGAGLLVRSLGRLVAVDPGFAPEGLATVPVILPKSAYPEDPHRVACCDRTLAEVAALPGVRAAAVTQSMPFVGDWVYAFSVVGQPPDEPGKEPSANFYAVTPDYFRAMGIRLLAGRSFTAADVDPAPGVFVVNEMLARQFFPDGGALGKRLSLDGGKTSYEIVGVVADVKHYGLGQATTYQIYAPYGQAAYPFLNVVVRGDLDPTALAGAIRARVAGIDPNQPVGTLRMMTDVMSDSVGRERFSVILLAVFAAVALVMAIIGIYGVIADAVTQRTHEIGVRMALGARRSTVVRLMMAQGLVPAAVGVALGVAGALATTRLLASLLYGIGATDLATMLAAVGVILAVATLAAYVPARRATRVDPIVALRAD